MRRTPKMILCLYLVSAMLAVWLPTAAVHASQSISIDANTPIGPLYDFWSIRNYTEANEPNLRLGVDEPHATAVNLVRVFGAGQASSETNSWFLYADGNTAVCDFTGLIDIVDGVIRNGLTPMFVIDNVPWGMSPGESGSNFGNPNPPDNYDVWHSYVSQAMQALVDRYGMQTVKQWVFRVGTEPDLLGHWTAGESHYFKHYDWTVDAIQSVIPDPIVGPGNILQADKYTTWGLNIIDHAATGTNYKTGQIGTEMDYFGISWYYKAGDPLEGFDTAIDAVKNRLSLYPQFANIPVSIQEFGMLQDETGKIIREVDATEYGASWFAAMTHKIYSHGLERVHQWRSFSSSGLSNPTTHLLDLLEDMKGGTRLSVSGNVDSGDDQYGILASERDGGYDLLIYRHRTARSDGTDLEIDFTITGSSFSAGNWMFSRGNILDSLHDGHHRSFLDDLNNNNITINNGNSQWSSLVGSMGIDALSLYEANDDQYRSLSNLDSIETLPSLSQSGNALSFSLSLKGHSVVYLRLTNGLESSPPSSANDEDVVFNDEFNNNTTGENPSGWTVSESTGASVSVVNNVATVDKVVNINDASTANQASVTRTFSNKSQTLTASWKWKEESAGNWLQAGLMSDGVIAVHVATRTVLGTKQAVYSTNNGADKYVLGTLADNRWYGIQIVADVKNNTFDIYFNGVLKAIKVPFNNSVSHLNAVKFYTTNQLETNGYIDNVKVSEAGNLLNNSGFELDGASTQNPSEWNTSGSDQDANYIQSGGLSGDFDLVHWKGTAPYDVYTYQTVDGLMDGLYTLRAWVKSDFGGLENAYMEVKDYGGIARQVDIPVSSTWTQISISDIDVTNGQSVIGFYSDSPAGKWYSVDDVEFFRQSSSELLWNEGAEKGISSPYHWSTWTNGNGVFTWDDTVSHEGDTSIKVSNSSNNSSLWYQYREDLIIGEQYQVKAWIKTANVTNSAAYLSVDFKDSSGNMISTLAAQKVSGTNNWTEYTLTFTVPANTYSVSIGGKLYGGTGDAWFDEFSLIRL